MAGGSSKAGSEVTLNSRERILAAATRIAQAHGYGGMNVRDLAAEVGIKAASIYHHFPSKAALGAAVAQHYREAATARLEALRAESADARQALRQYPATFRTALQNDNRLCLASFMAAEYDDMPEPVRQEAQAFAAVNIAWLGRQLEAAGLVGADAAEPRAQAIFAAIAGAQLLARSRADIALFDRLIDSYRSAGLLPD